MNTKALQHAFINFGIGLTGALSALWVNVEQFSDVNGPAYAVAFLGAVATGFNTYKNRMAKSPEDE